MLHIYIYIYAVEVSMSSYLTIIQLPDVHNFYS